MLAQHGTTHSITVSHRSRDSTYPSNAHKLLRSAHQLTHPPGPLRHWRRHGAAPSREARPREPRPQAHAAHDGLRWHHLRSRGDKVVRSVDQARQLCEQERYHRCACRLRSAGLCAGEHGCVDSLISPQTTFKGTNNWLIH